MLRMLIVAVAILAAGSYYLFGGRKLDQEGVDDFYKQDLHATFSRDPELACKLLADNFQGTSVSVMAGQRMTATQDKKQACAAYAEFWQSVTDIGKSMGGIAQLDYTHEVESVEFSPDRKTAIVHVKYSMDIAGRMMRVRGKAVDTLIRRHGRVFRFKSEQHDNIVTPAG